ncbi:hypothetical protein HOG48_05410 [Candidatus Peregrinibacteria bacterium]|jgi:hypothetical protein|nr:hypothetical protein [Candidatus Peregrinibacteria bacterium]
MAREAARASDKTALRLLDERGVNVATATKLVKESGGAVRIGEYGSMILAGGPVDLSRAFDAKLEATRADVADVVENVPEEEEVEEVVEAPKSRAEVVAEAIVRDLIKSMKEDDDLAMKLMTPAGSREHIDEWWQGISLFIDLNKLTLESSEEGGEPEKLEVDLAKDTHLTDLAEPLRKALQERVVWLEKHVLPLVERRLLDFFLENYSFSVQEIALYEYVMKAKKGGHQPSRRPIRDRDKPKDVVGLHGRQGEGRGAANIFIDLPEDRVCDAVMVDTDRVAIYPKLIKGKKLFVSGRGDDLEVRVGSEEAPVLEPLFEGEREGLRVFSGLDFSEVTFVHRGDKGLAEAETPVVITVNEGGLQLDVELDKSAEAVTGNLRLQFYSGPGTTQRHIHNIQVTPRIQLAADKIAESLIPGLQSLIDEYIASPNVSRLLSGEVVEVELADEVKDKREIEPIIVDCLKEYFDRYQFEVIGNIGVARGRGEDRVEGELLTGGVELRPRFGVMVDDEHVRVQITFDADLPDGGSLYEKLYGLEGGAFAEDGLETVSVNVTLDTEKEGE